MASTRDKTRARALMDRARGLNYTKALRIVQAEHGRGPAASTETSSSSPPWLAGVYERNANSEAWMSWSVIGGGTTSFPTREDAATALGIPLDHPDWDGDTLISNEPDTADRARAGLRREALLNPQPRPGVLAVFIHPARQITSPGLCVYALPDDQRAITAMIGALTPAASAAEAIAWVRRAVEDARAHPTLAADESFVRDVFGVPPESPGPAAESALEVIGTLRDDFRGNWNTYVGNTIIGVLHTSIWD